MERIVIFASTERIDQKVFDVERNEVVARSFVPFDEAKALGIDVVRMPKDLVLWQSKKDDKGKQDPAKDRKGKEGKAAKPDVGYLHEIGQIVIAVIDGNGKVMNDFRGRNFRRPVPVDVSTLKELSRLFRIGVRAADVNAA